MRHLIVPFALIAMFSTAALAQQAPAPQPEARALKIGFVDVARALDGYTKRADLEKGAQKLADETKAKFDAMARELNLEALRTEIEQLKPGSPGRLELEDKFDKGGAQLTRFRRESLVTLEKEYSTRINELYGDIVKEVADVGREMNFDMILKDQTSDQDELRVVARVVLYSKPEFDLTNTVVERLNKKYAAQQQKAAAAEKPEVKPAAGNIQDAPKGK